MALFNVVCFKHKWHFQCKAVARLHTRAYVAFEIVTIVFSPACICLWELSLGCFVWISSPLPIFPHLRSFFFSRSTLTLLITPLYWHDIKHHDCLHATGNRCLLWSFLSFFLLAGVDDYGDEVSTWDMSASFSHHHTSIRHSIDNNVSTRLLVSVRSVPC